ncbi:PucR family transcriptional regulator [Gracilibacillus salinarum]|uniref:PucR family transcriptional regulator ligand-binding domain-containing protein n=1 Tax=Gracilibacillus salinarum TaxID=2932255 RepID=A0ABY4GK68_9BACI|nr:PucR family transcriptional regulator [Gracilibacillus salinarum]UOQ84167.1 PucR family transcriptional regulator ligand-binding domain-containing protein [Gracilibacillus salinarum]
MISRKSRKGMSLQKLLKLDPLQEAKQLSVQDADNVMVDHIHVIRSQADERFIRAGEFVLTTEYAFRHNAIELITFIEKLSERGAAGIGIKVDNYLTGVPEEVVRRAIALDFPVVEIAPDTVFSDVVQLVLEEIDHQKSEYLLSVYNRLHTFTNSIVAEEKLQDIVAELEQMIGNPIIIIDLTGNIIAPLLSIILDSNELYQLASALEKKAGTGTIEVELREEEFVAYAFPLTKKRIYSHTPYIACMETNQPLTDVDFLTLNKISSTLLVELTHLQFKDQKKEEYLSSFLRGLLLGEQTAMDQMKPQSAITNMNLDKMWLQVFILHTDEPSLMDQQYTIIKNNLNKTVKSKLLVTKYDREIVFLIADEDKQKLPLSIKMIENELERFWQHKENDVQFVLLIGKAVQKLADVSESYQQAMQTRNIYQEYDLEKRSVYFKDMHVYRLLYLLPNSEERNEYLQGILGPLLRNAKNEMLLETLRVYFTENKNMEISAKRLNIHYHTIVHRFERIKKLLGVDIEDPEVALELQIALKLMKNH